jgi:hypothetical protein
LAQNPLNRLILFDKLGLNRPDIVAIGTVGLAAGLLSGLLGISSGMVLVPGFVFFLGWNQRLAQGTALAVALPPIGLLAVLEYYQKGHVNFPVAILFALGLFIGGYFGGKLACRIPVQRLRQVFGAMLFLIGVKMLFRLLK